MSTSSEGSPVIYGQPVDHQPSCLIAHIGAAWMPGVREAAEQAADYARAQGWKIAHSVHPNLCIEPFKGLGAMRNMAVTGALQGEWDYLLVLDNDIRLDDPETILKLAGRGKLMVVPLHDQTIASGEEWHVLSDPMYRPANGLVRLRWHAVNCVLFDTALFRLLGPIGQRIFTDPMITNEEQYIFGWLETLGVYLWQDTDTLVTMLRPPTKLWEVLGRPNPHPWQEEEQLDSLLGRPISAT